MKSLGRLFAAFLLALLPVVAAAAVGGSVLTLFLSGPNPENNGQLLGFDLWIKTTFLDPDAQPGDQPLIGDPLWSGSVTLAFDPSVLTFDSFDFVFPGSDTSIYAPVWGSGDPCGPSALACISGIGFTTAPGASAYSTELGAGIEFGTILFQYHGGTSDLIVDQDSGSPFENGNSPPQNPPFTFDIVNPGVATVVPLPLAAWLMLSGLGMLGILGFRKTR